MSGSVTRRNWKPTGAMCTLRLVGIAQFICLVRIINIVYVNNDNMVKNPIPSNFKNSDE